jgi:hypothetical protein
MHFMPDTEDEDSAAETFWPEGYKQIIRENVPSLVKSELLQNNSFANLYERGYKDKFGDYAQFIEKIADMVAVGTENGADDGFDDIIHSFLLELPLPQLRTYACYTFPRALSGEVEQALRQSIITEYSQDNIYRHAYQVGYAKTFLTFDGYLSQVAEIVLVGAENGANEVLEKLYRAFLIMAPMMPARRHPRRLKVW